MPTDNQKPTRPKVPPPGQGGGMDPCPDGSLCVFDNGKCVNCGVPQAAYEEEDE